MKYIYTFAVPIIFVMLLIPILSIEGVIPWGIYIYFTYKIIKVSNTHNLDKKFIFRKIILYFSLSLILCIIYNLISILITHLVVSNL